VPSFFLIKNVIGYVIMCSAMKICYVIGCSLCPHALFLQAQSHSIMFDYCVINFLFVAGVA